MERYIDADNIVYWTRYVSRNGLESNVRKVAFSDEIARIPTADVVPKSEIVKEIFGEIEKLKHTKFDWSDVVDWDGIAELKKKYTGEGNEL